MRTLPKPTLDLQLIYTTCISTFRNNTKLLFESHLNHVLGIAATYDQLATNSSLHSIESEENIGAMSAKEFNRIYTEKFVPQESLGRVYYDELISKPAYGRCPLCNLRTVTTLDHHLPKAFYPALAITPINLIPACKDCNIGKLALRPENAEDVTIHPYFDNIENDIWLTCTILQTSPVSIRFDVVCPAHWNNVLKTRTLNHFNVLELGIPYGSNAAQEMEEIKQHLNGILNTDGPIAVHQHLQDTANSRSAANLNSWSAALYRGMAADNWFYSGGFNS